MGKVNWKFNFYCLALGKVQGFHIGRADRADRASILVELVALCHIRNLHALQAFKSCDGKKYRKGVLWLCTFSACLEIRRKGCLKSEMENAEIANIKTSREYFIFIYQDTSNLL